MSPLLSYNSRIQCPYTSHSPQVSSSTLCNSRRCLSATAKLTFPRQNLRYHGKTYSLTAKLTFPRQNLLFHGKNLHSHGKTFMREWVPGLHGLLVWFWRPPRIIAFQLDFWSNKRILIKNDFLKHKQANISVESRRFGVIMTPFSRQSESIAKIWFLQSVRINIITKDQKNSLSEYLCANRIRLHF